MKYPELKGICKYCLGCERLATLFTGVNNCKNFMEIDKNWYPKYLKEIKKL